MNRGRKSAGQKSIRDYVKKIFELDSQGMSVNEISCKLIISSTSIYQVLNGQIYQDLTKAYAECRTLHEKTTVYTIARYVRANIDKIFELEKTHSAVKTAKLLGICPETVRGVLAGRHHKDLTAERAQQRVRRVGRSRKPVAQAPQGLSEKTRQLNIQA